jgi:hypothetical protein
MLWSPHAAYLQSHPAAIDVPFKRSLLCGIELSRDAHQLWKKYEKSKPESAMQYAAKDRFQ